MSLAIVEWPPEQVRSAQGSFYVFRGKHIVAGPYKTRAEAQVLVDKLIA